MAKNKTKIEELVDLKKLVNSLKTFKSDDYGMELCKKECHAIANYVLELENKILDLEKELADSKKAPTSVTPVRNEMGYYPVCPKCGSDLGDRIGSRYCECGVTLNWISV